MKEYTKLEIDCLRKITELVKEVQEARNKLKEQYPLIYKLLYGDDKQHFVQPNFCNWQPNTHRFAAVPNVYLPSSIFIGCGI